MAWTEFWGSPDSVVHELWMYWVIALPGSRASAEEANSSKNCRVRHAGNARLHRDWRERTISPSDELQTAARRHAKSLLTKRVLSLSYRPEHRILNSTLVVTDRDLGGRRSEDGPPPLRIDSRFARRLGSSDSRRDADISGPICSSTSDSAMMHSVTELMVATAFLFCWSP